MKSCFLSSVAQLGEGWCELITTLTAHIRGLRRGKGKFFMNFRSGTPARRRVRLTSLVGIYHSGCPSLLFFVLTSRNIEFSASQSWAWVQWCPEYIVLNSNDTDHLGNLRANTLFRVNCRVSFGQ